MIAKRIVACLDCKDGCVIKGTKFQSHEVVGDILPLAQRYSEEGIDELVLYDITASSEARTLDTRWIRNISRHLRIPFTVAGGIDSLKKAEDILNSGAEKVSINSPAIQNPSLINAFAKQFGSQAVVVSIDTQIENGIHKIYKFTGKIEKTQAADTHLFDWIREVVDRGAGELVINSIQQDGMRSGYDIALLKKVKAMVRIPVVASGGAGSIASFVDVFEQAGVDAALAASVFHKNIIPPQELKIALKKHNIHVRI